MTHDDFHFFDTFFFHPPAEVFIAFVICVLRVVDGCNIKMSVKYLDLMMTPIELPVNFYHWC